MKIDFKNSEIKEAINSASIVNSDNAVVKMRIGAYVDEKNGKVGASLAVLGATQQYCALIFHDTCDGIKEMMGKEYAFKGKEFFSIIQGLINLNKDIYMEFTDNACFLGIEGVVRLPLGILDGEAVPDILVVDSSKAILKAN